MESPPVDNFKIAGAFTAQGAEPAVDLTPDEQLGATNQNPAGVGFWELVREDLRTHDGDPFAQGFWALFVHRLGNWRMGVRNKVLRWPFSVMYKVLFKLVQWTCGISLAYTVKVGRRVKVWHFGGMVLGARYIGNDVHIRQNTTFGVARRGDPRWKKPVIEDRCDIGAGAVIVGDITIGHDSQVGANAVVLKSVPAWSVAVGVPAKVIKTIKPEDPPALSMPVIHDEPPPPPPAAPVPADDEDDLEDEGGDASAADDASLSAQEAAAPPEDDARR